MVFPSIAGKVAIITGSASGIGRATAYNLAENGAILSLIDVDENGLNNVAKKCEEISAKFNTPKPLVFIGDLSQDIVRKDFVDATVKKFGKIDILINNAGIEAPSSVFDTSMDNAAKLFKILLMAPYDMCRLTANHLVKTKGCIVNLGSVCGHVVMSGNPAYHSSKAAIIHLTMCFADELGPHNVRVNSISPGPINTNINRLFPTTADGENRLEKMGKDSCTLKRWGQPEEVANVIAFMVSDKSSYMTGSDVLVDGGCLARHRTDL